MRILRLALLLASTSCAGRIDHQARSAQAEGRRADLARQLAACQQKGRGHEASGWSSAAYFERISCRVTAHWTTEGLDAAACAEADEQGSHAYVVLYLLPDGSVESMAISTSSGHKAWDAAAISAVTSAGPFAAPPRESPRPGRLGETRIPVHMRSPRGRPELLIPRANFQEMKQCR